MLQLIFVQVFAMLLVLYFTKRSVLSPTVWEDPNPLPELTGKLEPNRILAPESVRHLHGGFAGPESTAFDDETGIAYVSFNDGTVGSFIVKGKDYVVHERVLFFSGAFVQKYDFEQTKNHSIWCDVQIQKGKIPWSPSIERKCGRPLGLRFRKETDGKYLYVLDAYHGLFKINLLTKHIQTIFNDKTPIQPIDNSDPTLQLPIKFFNDLDIFDNGDILFTDSSYRNTRSENRQEILDGAPRGRLFLYQVATQQLHVKLCGLHFPNGAQVLFSQKKGKSSSREVIITDSTRFRLLQVNIDAPFLEGTMSLPLKTSPEHISAFTSCQEYGSLYHMLKEENYEVTGVKIFTDSLPGFPDNIRIDTFSSSSSTSSESQKYYYLIGIGTLSKAPFSLLWSLYQTPIWIRDIIGKFLPMKYVEKLVPKYGMVLVVNEEGEIVTSLQDPTGKGAAFISQAERHPITGDLWLGSHSEDRIVILPRNKIPTTWESS